MPLAYSVTAESSGRSQPPAAAPRLIEFGLRCARLFEPADSGRTRVPHRIDRIKRFAAVDVDCAVPVHAVARRRSTATGIDIDIVDATGIALLSIEAYETVALDGEDLQGRPNSEASRA